MLDLFVRYVSGGAMAKDTKGDGVIVTCGKEIETKQLCNIDISTEYTQYDLYGTPINIICKGPRKKS